MFGGIIPTHETAIINSYDDTNKITIKTISSIKQVIDIIDDIKTPIVIGFDWDNCISLSNGCNFPFREDDITSNVFKQLNKKNIPWFVMTSRLQGISYNTQILKQINPKLTLQQFNQCIINMINNMELFLKELDHYNTPKLNTPTLTTFVDIDDKCNIHFTKNVVFAGGISYYYDLLSKRLKILTCKGYAFKKMVENNLLPRFKTFIYVDNDIVHLNAIITIFKELKKLNLVDKDVNLICLFYPQIPLISSLENCDVYDIDKCFRQDSC
jgi:hypothetical protein